MGGRRGGRGSDRWDSENFSPVVARIKRLIVKATCAREPLAGVAAESGAASAMGARRSDGGEKVAGGGGDEGSN